MSPVGYSPWVHKESDTTEQLTLTILSWSQSFSKISLFLGCMDTSEAAEGEGGELGEPD